MNTIEPQYSKGVVRLSLEDGQSLEATPQECWRIIERVSSYLIENYNKFVPIPVQVIKKHKKSFCVSITKNLDFWKSVEDGRWEPNTFKIFDNFLSADCICLDIGAWIGPTALYVANLAKHTYAFEPDPVAYQELELNVHVNKNTEWVSRLTIYNKAIASSCGTIKLGSRSSGGDSMSSILFRDKNTNWDVKAVTLQQVIKDEKLQNEKLFIKMDIEGGEYELIPKIKDSLTQNEVTLYISIHPKFLMKSLMSENEDSISKRVLRRLLFVWRHIKLINSLPFKYLYHSNGQRINIYKQILRTILLAKFVTEIVATNAKWDSV